MHGGEGSGIGIRPSSASGWFKSFGRMNGIKHVAVGDVSDEHDIRAGIIRMACLGGKHRGLNSSEWGWGGIITEGSEGVRKGFRGIST